MIGYVYKICDNTNNNVYYGSTTLTLNKRLREHKLQKRCSSKYILKNNNYIMILVETIEFQDKKQLLIREKYYIQNYPCINERLPITTYEERKEQMKKYYELNKEQINEKHKEYDKEYYELNKDKKKEYYTKYYKANKEKYYKANKEKVKEYYEANKQQLNEKRKEKMTCDCGSIVRKCDIVRHKKTKRHLNYVNSINEVN